MNLKTKETDNNLSPPKYKSPYPNYKLHGWDDEKIYFWTGKEEMCVSDCPELMMRLIDICRKYFKAYKSKESRKRPSR